MITELSLDLYVGERWPRFTYPPTVTIPLREDMHKAAMELTTRKAGETLRAQRARAAKAAGVSVYKVSTWLSDPQFKQAVDQRRRLAVFGYAVSLSARETEAEFAKRMAAEAHRAAVKHYRALVESHVIATPEQGWYELYQGGCSYVTICRLNPAANGLSSTGIKKAIIRYAQTNNLLIRNSRRGPRKTTL